MKVQLKQQMLSRHCNTAVSYQDDIAKGTSGYGYTEQIFRVCLLEEDNI